MTTYGFLILAFIIVVRTMSDISLKFAVHKLQFSSVQSIGPNLVKLFKNPFLWIGGGLAVGNMVLWTVSLTQYDLSYAYPFLSISYIPIILAGRFLFHEHLDRNKLIGLGFIVAGGMTLFL